jgi:DNA-binding Lrp family transcriptional regulator
MVLKPQDLLIVLKLWVSRGQAWTYPTLAKALRMSPSEAHAAIRRAHAAGLLMEARAEANPNPEALKEFLLHGVRYAFAPDRGEQTRGIPTAHAAPPLAKSFQATEEPPPVWPYAKGPTRGQAFSPLYRSAPEAALEDPALYELLALVDALRGGRTRERNLAAKALTARIP